MFNLVHVITRTISSHNNAQLVRINVLNHEASDGKCAPRVVPFDLEPGVIDAISLSRRSASYSARETS
jgi:hypothetical protein